MKAARYKYILIFITITILATIGLQFYWNLKNYKENRVQLIKEVQIAFDNSIEYYYVEDSKNDFMAIVDQNHSTSSDEFLERVSHDTNYINHISRVKSIPKKAQQKQILKDTDTVNFAIASSYSLEVSSSYSKDGQVIDLPKKINDSLKNSVLFNPKDKKKSTITIDGNPNKISSIRVLKGKRATDSISKIATLVNKIIVAMVQDSITFTKLSKALDKELIRKNIMVEYSLQHYKSDTLFDTFKKNNISKLPLSTFSGTTYLPDNQKLQISFSDPTILILKRSFTEILLSLALSLSIIFCLLYLLKTINKQKKVDEIKNDLISNITHEFKTPITTISSAIEGIRNFNDVDDKEKTDRYLTISGQQLKKLEIMVEKLLETASLDTNELVLKKEPLNLIELIKANIDKHQMVASDKVIKFSSNREELVLNLDAFHFENVISNLIDNALKYGGNNIQISLYKEGNHSSITVEDNGNGIEKSQREKIFDKFYRIPKGNIHDVKGFGIGLFYSKKIIEKHGGMLELVPNVKTTIFKINLPDA